VVVSAAPRTPGAGTAVWRGAASHRRVPEQQGVDPRDAGTAGALNNVSQQLGSALGIAVISTFVATATNHYLARTSSEKRSPITSTAALMGSPSGLAGGACRHAG
jgi:hypothetical protein